MNKPIRCTALLSACAALLLAACGSSEPDPRRAPPQRAAPAAPTFSPASVPETTFELPAFPYLKWPDAVPARERTVAKKVDSAPYSVIAGETLRDIQGRLEQHKFAIPQGQLPLAMRRHYSSLFTTLGAIQVNDLQPVGENATINPRVQALVGADANAAERLDLQNYDEGQYQYAVFLSRTPDKLIWFVLQSSQFTLVATVIEEPISPAG